MQRALRPYTTAGIALVGASMIAVTPVAAPPPSGVQVRPVQLLADPYSDLFTDTLANLQNIVNGADGQAITSAFTAFFTNPLGVIDALTNVTPSVTADISSLPATISVELPPGLELGIAQLAAEAATLNAVNGVVGQLTSDPSNAFTTLIDAPAVITNAYLNGADNISLLDGTINIPTFNGVLAPLQSLTVDLNLTNLLDALGLGNLSLSDLNLDDVLGAFGINTPLSDLSNLSLSGILSSFGVDVPTGTTLGATTLTSLLSDLGLGNLGLGTLLTDASPLLPADLQAVISALLATPDVESLLNQINLGDLVTGVTLGQGTGGALPLDTLLGDLGVSLPSSTDLANLDIGDVLTNLGVALPDNLTIGGVLGDLGLGDLANISVNPFGGLITELVDTVPQQILAALG